MSASGSGGGLNPRVRELFNRASNSDRLLSVIFQGIGGVLFAIGAALVNGIFSLQELVTIPLNALATSAGAIVEAFFGGAAFIVQSGAAATGLSVGPGGLFDLGPLGFGLAIGAALLGFYILAQFLSQAETGNVVPGLPDVPTPLLQDAEEDNEEE